MAEFPPKYLGIIYHNDSETDNDNYCLFVYGNTKDEINDKFRIANTPRYTEETKILEFGVDVSTDLHSAIKNDLLGINYDWVMRCGDKLKDILNLDFLIVKEVSYKINK